MEIIMKYEMLYAICVCSLQIILIMLRIINIQRTSDIEYIDSFNILYDAFITAEVWIM